MSTMTAQTYFARDLIELGEIHDGLVGLSIIDGRAPVLLIDWPGDSVEFPIGPALAAVLISAGNRAQRLALEDRMDTLPGLSGPWPDVSEPAPDLSGPTVPELVAAAWPKRSPPAPAGHSAELLTAGSGVVRTRRDPCPGSPSPSKRPDRERQLTTGPGAPLA